MKELEVQTYNFAVEGIGFVKSLEKEFPDAVPPGLKQNIGNVSIKFIDTLNATENDDFANNLRDCLSDAKKSEESLSSLKGITNETLIKQKEKLVNNSKIIIEKLEGVISKLIY